ncbi:MAG: extracellular solute-binding protein [Candidatus Pacebacteria bacterium]|nr:extracellular solute-binding protein [Candidatus Paceibacterota bacterium]
MSNSITKKNRLGQIALSMTALLLIMSPAKAAAERVVNVFSWADYVDPKVVKNFEKETGIKVVFDTYDSASTVEAKLATGASGYDVVNTDELTSERLARIGQLKELDRSKIPNWKNLDPAILRIMALSDPGNKYNAPLYHGTFGIMYNVDKVKAVDPSVTFESFASLLDPAVIGKFAKCGVNLYDGNMEHYGMYQITKGKSGNIKTPDQIKESEEAFMKIRPFIRKIDAADYVNAMATSEICVTTAFSGDYLFAMNKAAGSGVKLNLKFVMPKEGGQSWTDGWIIPKTSVNQAEAHAFINYMLEAKNAAANTNFTNYPNGVLTAKPFVKKELLDNPAVYFPTEKLAKMETYFEMPPGIGKLMTKSWNRFKSGR